MAEIQLVLGQIDDAEETFQRASQFYERLRQTRPEKQDYVVGLAAVKNELGRIAGDTRRFSESLALHREALDLLIGNHRAVSTTARGRFELARTYDLIGIQLTRHFRRSGATDDEADSTEVQSHLQRALGILEELAAEEPANGHYRFAMAQCHRHLSSARRRREPHDGDQRAIGLLEDLIDDFPDNPRYKRELALIIAFTSDHRHEEA